MVIGKLWNDGCGRAATISYVLNSVRRRSLFERARLWARHIKSDVVALYIAIRDPRTPWHAKAVACAVVAYAVSPIDLIPDFIPVVGYLDDLIIVALGIMLAVRLIPVNLMAEFRLAAIVRGRIPASRIGMAIVIWLWILAALLLARWVTPYFYWPYGLVPILPRTSG